MTRAAIETRILSLYTAGSEAEAYNISEIARKTGAAYPHVYNAVQEMLRGGLLQSRELGRSTFCTPNLSNDLTRNLLAQALLRKRAVAAKKPNMGNLIEEIHRLAIAFPSILSVLFHKGQLIFLLAEKKDARKILRETSLINLSFLTPEELRQHLKKDILLLRGSALYGYEQLLLQLLPIHQDMVINHSRCFRGEVRR